MLLQLASILSPVLPIVLFLVFLLRTRKVELWVIFFYLILSFSTDLTTNLQFKDAYWTILPYYTIVEFAIAAAYFLLVAQKKRTRIGIWIFSGIIFLCLIGFRIALPKTGFDSLAASVESTAIIILSLVFFFQKITDDSAIFIFNTSQFWIVFAFLTYMAGTLFLFIVASQNATRYWFINDICNIIKNLLFGLGFLVQRFGRPENPTLDKPYVDFTDFPQGR